MFFGSGSSIKDKRSDSVFKGCVFIVQILKLQCLSFLCKRTNLGLLGFIQHVLQVRWLITDSTLPCGFFQQQHPTVVNCFCVLFPVCSILWFSSVHSLLSLNDLFLSRLLRSLNTTLLFLAFLCLAKGEFDHFSPVKFSPASLGIWTATSGSYSLFIVTFYWIKGLPQMGKALHTEWNCSREVEMASWVTPRVLESESYLLSFGGIRVSNWD